MCSVFVVNDVVRVVETLGAEKALELLYITEDLEEAGGLLILVCQYLSLHPLHV